ncbi:monovalent cation/H+ antiporter subunit A [Methanosarcina sp. 2.H.T.1A.6]|nr:MULTISPECIES: hydrogen gas-evolving membrane-bound hydrogenase subunit E [unclassified Methanosarcina]KKG14482.1 monovalent cation/H+ antiporter subunit A [Methanosarcina sp. 2.H.T.1A.3]KKG24266.1 monovalent cation/H+ antiporter subunit A [Methanosarcina sp. 2.H.T.1A.8]KKG24921.1 monovalent cation/H+ antiporter subunit A [Methanosarcina sp. 2.H.T.1A.6]
MDPFNAIVIAVFLPFILAWTLPVLYRVFKQRIGWISALIAFTCFVLNAQVIPYAMAGTPVKGSWDWLPAAGLSLDFYGDGMAVLLALIVSGVGVIIMSYSNGYMSTKEDLPRYYQWLLLFMGAMLGIAYTDNTIQMFIFWELTSITSFMLIGYWRERPESVYGATKAFLITAGGGLVMFAGFLMLRVVTGTYGISEVAQSSELLSTLHGSPFYVAVLVLIFIGAASKSAQGPFYIWLPNAMEAPTPVSAFLHSATMVKAGVYLVARMHPILSGTPEWLILVSGTGMFTMVMAGFLAFRQTDIKAILAYSTISQLAYLMTMYGYSTAEHPGLGFAAATFHLLNHSTFKATLFLVAGIVAHEATTRDIRKLGGLRKEMPKTFIVAVIAAASMAGVPPLNGFLSKEMFYETSLEIGELVSETYGGPWAIVFPAVAVAGGVFTLMYSIKLIDGIFLGERTHDHDVPHHIHDAPWVMLAPAVFLAGLIIFFGLYPKFPVDYLIQPAYSGLVPHADTLHIKLWHGITTPLLMTIATFAIGLVLYKFYDSIAAWQNSFNAKLPWISVNYWYDATVNNAKGIAAKFGAVTQPGPIGGYIKAAMLFMIFLILWPVYTQGISLGSIFPEGLNFNSQPYEIVLYALMIVAALGAAIIPKYLPAVLSLSALGFLVSLLYMYLKAPDLAMTQVCVETLSTIIFILAIIKIPQKFKEPMPAGKVMVNFAISAVVTFAVFALMVNANAGMLAPFESFSHYFIDKSLQMTGGLNVVNVIVVDFRGYDTIGEISVLSLAALGVYNLILSRAGKAEGGEEE